LPWLLLPLPVATKSSAGANSIDRFPRFSRRNEIADCSLLIELIT
jgi:hypothetical protein